MPKELTIICPAHNAAAKIQPRLHSLETQYALEKLKFVFVDDCSTDNTSEIIDAWCHNQDAHLIRNKTNCGPGFSRNAALRETSTPYVAFVDADDWLHKQWSLDLISSIQKYDVEFIRSGFIEVHPKRRTAIICPNTPIGLMENPQHYIFPIGRTSAVDYRFSWAGVFQTDFLIDNNILFSESVISCEDAMFVWKLHTKGSKFLASPSCYYYYNKIPAPVASLTHTGKNSQNDFIKAFNETFTYLELNHPQWLVKAYRQFIALVYFHLEKANRLNPDCHKFLISQSRITLLKLHKEVKKQALIDFSPDRLRLINKTLEIEFA